MKSGNPFTLTFGKQPQEYISRYENQDMILSTFEADHPISQAYLIEGIRGSGKTVLMTSVARQLEARDNWIVIDLNSTQNLLDDMAMRLSDSVRKLPGILDSGFSISVAGFGLGFNGPDHARDSVSLIDEIFASLKKKRTHVLVTIDEVMPGTNLRQFASQFQIFIRKDYPLFLIMTGLYDNIYAVQNDPALTFLLRTPKIRLEPLSQFQIAKQYRSVFSIDENQARIFAEITKGYAFAFQAFGMLYYEYRDQLSLDDILSRLDDMLDDFVYRKIWDSLSGQDREIIKAMPEQAIRVGELCRKVQMTSAVFSKYRDRLIRKGLIASAGHGLVISILPRLPLIAQSYS